MKAIARNVLAGDKEWVTHSETKTADTRRDRPTVLVEATAWWSQRVRCYDILPHIRRCIIHPVCT
eukprot:1166097-Pleurochrysis_carterae.AAC.1